MSYYKKNSASRCYTEKIQTMKEKNRTLQLTLVIFLLGLFIRLVVMPFAMQADLLSMSFRAHLMSDYGFWGYNVGQLISHYIYAFNLLLMKFLVPLGILPTDFREIFINPASFAMNPGSNTSSVGGLVELCFTPTNKCFYIFP